MLSSFHKHKTLLLILGLGLLLRLFLVPFLTYRLDVYTYIYWSEALVNKGFIAFFVDNWVDYLPGYPYILWVLAIIKNFGGITSTINLYYLYKLPAILADIATAIIIFKLVSHCFPSKPTTRHSLRAKLPLIAAALYLFNPAIFANSSLWGQTDSFTGLTALAAIFFSLVNLPLLAGLSLGIGTLIKLNVLLVAPIVGLIFITRRKFSSFLIICLSTLTIFFIGFLPFSPTLPWSKPLAFLTFVSHRISITTNQYPHTSLNAFNLWFLLEGSWKSDQTIVLGLTKHAWGNILFLTISVVVLFNLLRRLLKSKSSPSYRLLAVSSSAALIFSAAFLVLTRMHERHLLAAFPFLLVASCLRPRLVPFYLWFSLSYIINLIFGYQQAPGNPQLLPLSFFVTKLFSLGNLMALTLLFYYSSLSKIFSSKLLESVNSQRKSKGSKPIIRACREASYSNAKLSPVANLLQHKALIVLLVISFLVRFIRLGTPPEYVFDEVYHAFTARQMLVGDIKAWEWWNPNPPGVAYEWTHPPLSKHFMVMGMMLFGNNAFGWRFPSIIFGTLNILLVYLLAKELFSYKLQATSYKLQANMPLLAAALYSLESLSFVQSRVGMNDTYMLFFMLLSLLTLLRQKHLASAMSFGLAVATKWSAIYIVPVLGIAYLLIAISKSQTLKSIFLKGLFLGICFLVFAIAIYLLSYLPFFVSGHSWSQFLELQQQMFWYHTRLKATHDYASPWWSWPLLLRPVWYYVKYGALGNDNLIGNIYAFGNPIIFWGGLVAIFYSLINLVKNLIKKSLLITHYSLLIPLVGYAAFLLPWSLSPRIMFLYHYLPSIPFMVIILAWFLGQLWFTGKTGRILTTCYVLLATCSFIFFYPLVSALPVPKDFLPFFFWFKSWK